MTKSEFELRFEQKEVEILVLFAEGCAGAAVEKKWMFPTIDFAAMVDVKNQEFINKKGILTWIISNDNNRKDLGFDFKHYGIYRLLVRKFIPVESNQNQSEICNNRYMVVKILEENAQNKDLQNLKEYLQTPVVLENELGVFTLNREFSWFECEMDWNGQQVSVTVTTDEDCEKKADMAMAVLFRYAEDKAGFDQKNKDFAVQELLELANEWLDVDESDEIAEITKEMFLESIEMCEFGIESDGSVTLFYSDGDLFYGHSIEICISADGEYDRADIAG